ncbi:MAG: hypothetical protein RR315_08345, partial [Oscillospiraceae bacterium]
KTSTVEEAQNVQAYIVTMLGGLITGDFNVYNLNGKFVLYLSNTTPETVALIQAVFDKTDDVPSTDGAVTLDV